MTIDTNYNLCWPHSPPIKMWFSVIIKISSPLALRCQSCAHRRSRGATVLPQYSILVKHSLKQNVARGNFVPSLIPPWVRNQKSLKQLQSFRTNRYYYALEIPFFNRKKAYKNLKLQFFPMKKKCLSKVSSSCDCRQFGLSRQLPDSKNSLFIF